MRIAKLFFIITAAALLGGCGPSKAEEERAVAAELAKRLRAAAGDNNTAEVIQLLDNGADVNMKNMSGQTPLHRAARENAAAVAKILIDNGAEVNAKVEKGDYVGWTPMDVAIDEKHAEMQSFLKQHGGECSEKC